MALTAAALCPHPIALVPELAAEPQEEWAELRAACREAVAQLNFPVAGGPHTPSPHATQLVVIVGADHATRSFDPSTAYASLQNAGVWWTFGWGQDTADSQPLPLTLSLGDWLLTSSRPGNSGIITCTVAFEAVDYRATPQECTNLGV